MNDAFFNFVGHDLRGELATMLAGVHYLIRYEKGLGKPATDMLERVNGAGLRLKRLLEEFDNAVWIEEAGRSADGSHPARPLSVEPYELAGLVERVVTKLAKSAEAREVTVRVDVPQSAPGTLLGDPEILATALEYAVEFSVARSKGQTVTIVGRVDERQGVIELIDEAGVVAPDSLGRLLEPFAEREVIPRIDATQRRRERLGMGLAIAHAMLRAHGGGVEASAAPNGIRLLCSLGRADAERKTA